MEATDYVVSSDDLPVIAAALRSLQTPRTLAAFLLGRLPWEYQHVSERALRSRSPLAPALTASRLRR